jgi:hypothetical protein
MFNRKYNAEVTDEEKPNRVPSMETNSLIMSRNGSRMEGATSRMEDTGTEVEIVRGFGGFGGNDKKYE